MRQSQIVRQVRGFRLFLSERYEGVIDEGTLDELLAGASRWSSTRRKQRPLWSVRELPGGLHAHVKYWVPRRARHRIKSLWQPTEIETEGRQYERFMRCGLPVPELIMWGSRRLPGRLFGIYMTGLIVTRAIEGARSLAALAGQRKEPWACAGQDRRRLVLERLAQILARIHRSRLVHGDYMLKNCMYAPGEPEGRYWIVDMASGWPLPAGDPQDGRGRYRDLLRMVLSLARNGFGGEDALCFLECYFRQWAGAEGARRRAQKALEFCLRMADHRAEEAAVLLRRNAPGRER